MYWKIVLNSSFFFSLGFSSLVCAQEKNDSEAVIDEITVTGKRAQKNDEIDAAVVVATADDLEQAGVTRVEQLEKVFPGLQIKSRGNRAFASLSVRGVTSPDFYNPSIQVYVDDVPQDFANFTQELVNVDRVELLRGPQGTLYGRNAQGGIINVVTKGLSSESKNRVQLSLADNEQSAKVNLNAAIIPDALYVGLSAGTSDYNGDIDDIGTGETDINGTDSDYVNLTLQYAPQDSGLDVQFSVQESDLTTEEELFVREFLVEDRAINSLTPGTDSTPFVDREVTSYSLRVNNDFGDYRFTSITAYQDRTLDRTIFGFDFPETQELFTQELRVAFSGEKSNGVLGAFYQDSEFTRGAPGSLNQVDTKSYAIFGEYTYSISNTVDLTGGIRWSRDEADIDFQGLFPTPLAFVEQDSFSDVSPKVAIGWQLAKNHRIYASVTRGFKPGGFNRAVANDLDSIPFDSETSTSFELGWRANWLNDRVQFSSAIYSIEAQDSQIFVGPVGVAVLRNVGDATSTGVEFELNAVVSDSLTINAGLTHGSSEFDNATDPLTGNAFDGNTLPYAPDTTAQLSANYIISQNILPGELSINSGVQYVSDTFFDEANTLEQDGYVLFDASIDLNLDNGLKLSLFSRNLTDEVFRTSSFEFGDGQRSTLNEARVIGAKASFEF